MNQVTEWYGIDVEERKVLMDRLKEVFIEKGYLDEVYVLEPQYQGEVDVNYTIAQLQIKNDGEKVFIKIGRYINERDNVLPIIALAHELGHFVDLNTNFGGSLSRYIGILGCIESEVRAWEYAMDFLKEIGFSPEYMSVAVMHAEECLETYRHGLTAWLLNNRFDFHGESPSKEECKARVTIRSLNR